MDITRDMSKQEYDTLIKQREKHSPIVKDCIFAFLIGGAICVLGQLIREGWLALGLSDQDAAYYDAHRHTYDKTYSLHPGGDGRNGVAETYLSGASFQEHGSQSLRMVRRADCNGETAGALALAYRSTGDELYKVAAYNILNWLLT